ncbi:MAG TPA: tetratricopeptide repeat protein [Ktedonobacterales bacterium]
MDTPHIFISHWFDDGSREYAKMLADELSEQGAHLPNVYMAPNSVRCQYEVPADVPLPENDEDGPQPYGHVLRIAGHERLQHYRRTRSVQILIITKRALESRDLERQAEWATSQYFSDPVYQDPRSGGGIVRFFFAVYAEDVRRELLWPVLEGIDSITLNPDSLSSEKYSERELIRSIDAEMAAKIILEEWKGVTRRSLRSLAVRISPDGSLTRPYDLSPDVDTFEQRVFEVAFHTGRGYLAQGMLEKAETQFRRAIQISNGALEAGYFLAACYFQRGEYKTCEQILQESLANLPLDRSSLRNRLLMHSVEALRGAALAADGNHRFALEAYRVAQTYSQDVARTWLLIGESMAAGGPDSKGMQAAEGAFRRANMLDPHMPEPFDRLAECYFMLGRANEARACRREADKLRERYRLIGEEDQRSHLR